MMPLIFIGHGSPMNAIDNNEFTKNWSILAKSIPKPKAILSISAHYLTNGTFVTTTKKPKTIHDFYGFPKALYDIEYKALGSPEFAFKTLSLLGDISKGDDNWGIDHGTWSVLNIMYKNADIPVFQLSVDKIARPEEIFEIGKKLKPLRHENVLIMGSGNVVHNLRLIDFYKKDGYDWAYEFDDFISDRIKEKDFESVLNYKKLGESAKFSVPTTDHFNPLIYILGSADKNENIKVFNKSCILGSLSMTSYEIS